MSEPFGPATGTVAIKKPVGMFVHSCYVPKLPDMGDAVVTKQHVHYPDGRVGSELVVYDKPVRSFYVTKKQYQNHTDKKESEYLTHLDRYQVENSRMEYEIFRALNGFTPNRRPRLRELCASPFLYGADISIEALIKNKCKTVFEKSGLVQQRVTTGFLDAETSVQAEDYGRLIMLTYTHENEVYTAIARDKFYTLSGERQIPADPDEFLKFAQGILNPVVDGVVSQKDFKKRGVTNNFKLHVHVADTEIGIIQWIFGNIHRCKTDFVGVWNINFDIPKIFEVIKRADMDPKDIFCPPDLDPRYRYVNYVIDSKKVEHPADKWHWLHCTSYTQFYDAMSTYRTLRKVIGLEVSYRLNDILIRNGVHGKLDFKEDEDISQLVDHEWHLYMQTREPLKYAVYNMFDCISIQLMEWKNRDVQSMYQMSGNTSLSKYTRQTVKACDNLYFDWISDPDEPHVMATTSANMETEYDELIESTGGAVLRPERMDNIGLCLFSDAPMVRTLVTTHNNDIDFTAMYPTIGMAGNISKKTKLSTAVAIEAEHVQKLYTPGKAVEIYFGYLVSPRENAMPIAIEFYGLPNYEGVANLYAEYRKQKSA